jgi:hypothetical protein
MNQNDAFIINTADSAKKGIEGIRRNTSLPGNPSRMRRGVVTAVSSGVYTVAIPGANSETAESIAGLRVWGSSAFETGDKVLLFWSDQIPVPYIIGTGAGAGSGEITPVLVGSLGFLS